MPNYRRANLCGATYFFTLVTYDRRGFLTEDCARTCLRRAWRRIQKDRPFVLQSVCLLPNHLHCMWTLPEGDNDFSTRWKGIKALFTRYYLEAGGSDGERNLSRLRTGEAAVWQRRFWEHLIRDQTDYARHMDYIHYNPVKHGLTSRPADWPWSTFHRYVRQGVYRPDWGQQDMQWTEDFATSGE